MVEAPSILRLQDIQTEEVGGKAKGLAELIRLKLPVPAGFVIMNAKQGQMPSGLLEAYQAIGAGNVAVRSSALGEDAGDNSFAGQFETILNVQGAKQLVDAIEACVASLQSDRASAYQKDREHDEETTMCVVVQQMVDAKFAGVLFSADPVTGRHDRLVIDAVAGLGEALVSGEASSDHYLLDNDDNIVNQQLQAETPLLNEAMLTMLSGGAREASRLMGEPLDMEWAIGQDNKVYWLQARPITTIGTDLNELDTRVANDHVITRCNVGEIFPGAACPLTFSLQGHALDYSLKYMQNAFAQKDITSGKDLPQIAYVGGQLFLDLTSGLEASKYTVLARAETTAQSICGRTIPELVEPAGKKNIIRRLWGIKSFLDFCNDAHDVTAEFARKLKTFYVEYAHDSKAMFAELDRKRGWLDEASCMHLQSSARSGALEGFVQGIITKGKPSPTLEEQALAAKLFAGAENVESAVLVDQLDQVVDLISQHEDAKTCFQQVSAEEAYAWVVSDNSGAVRRAFEIFLENHGHRGYKELDLREPGWADNPVPLIESMQASVQARFQGISTKVEHNPVNLSDQPWLLRWMLPKAHTAIRGREHTKSMMVKVAHIMKRGYRHLGELLVKEGKLSNPELVFFFTQEELGDFVAGKAPEMARHVEKRLMSYEFQDRLIFDDISVGKPDPQEPAAQSLEDGQLAGRPVSKGVVEGVARVAKTLAEAAELQPGEILIAPITDVGWTPYFSMISGLATDIGSAVSHGAVIAREYGLPCIVNMQIATSTFQTGDRVRLDADLGVLTKLDS